MASFRRRSGTVTAKMWAASSTVRATRAIPQDFGFAPLQRHLDCLLKFGEPIQNFAPEGVCLTGHTFTSRLDRNEPPQSYPHCDSRGLLPPLSLQRTH